jgi:putative resolvase
MEEKFWSTGKAAKILRVHKQTVFRWIHAGKIKATMNPAGRWLVPQSEIDRLLGVKREEKQRAIIYARVSSETQKEHLVNQVRRLKKYADEKGYIVVKTYQEIGSGLNERRRKLEQVYNKLRRREADVVLVEFKDRLSRFGFKYLEQLAESYGGWVEVVENDVKKDAMQELVEDMIAIVSSFSARLYGYRSQKFKKITEAVKHAVHG